VLGCNRQARERVCGLIEILHQSLTDSPSDILNQQLFSFIIYSQEFIGKYFSFICNLAFCCQHLAIIIRTRQESRSGMLEPRELLYPKTRNIMARKRRETKPLGRNCRSWIEMKKDKIQIL